MENNLVVVLPIFQPIYKRGRKYGWTDKKERQNLIKVLLEASNNFCMYCYRRVTVDHIFNGQIEHAIEKSNSDYLVECIPNMGISCSVCNQSLKRYNEQKRKIKSMEKEEFEKKCNCRSKRKQCMVSCAALRKLQKKYVGAPESHIILQPIGVKGEKSNLPYQIQYDIINSKFEPAISKYAYTEEDIKFIEDHIEQFRLNDKITKTDQILDFIKIVIDQHGKLPEYEYNNMVVELFAKNLSEHTIQDILKICEALYCASYITADF